MKKLIIILLLILAKNIYSQPSSSVNYFIKQNKATAVSDDNPLPEKINSEINFENASIVTDTNAQHYNTVVLQQQAPMNFTDFFAMSVGTNPIMLPTFDCRQVDLTIDFDYEGVVYIGNSGVNINNGIPLRAGDACTLYVKNTNEIYCLGTQSGANILRVKYSGRR
jgi:hypothetical protein